MVGALNCVVVVIGVAGFVGGAAREKGGCQGESASDAADAEDSFFEVVDVHCESPL